MDLDSCRSALIHHWFVAESGGERVCECLCELLDYPDVYTLVCHPSRLLPNVARCDITQSFIHKLPFARKLYRNYVWLFPLAVEQFDLNSYELVISSDASVMKGVLTQSETCHVCYCHSPIRYAWNLYQEHSQGGGRLKRWVISLVMHYLRLWDYAASARVDYFVANSDNVRKRIMKYYRRPARVIYPPCDVGRFAIASTTDDYYLIAGRLVPYKRADLAVEAFNENGKKLVVVGEGPELKGLKSIAKPNIEFAGWVSDQQLASLYSECKALIFPGEEDYGIVPVEAQASGRPVLAYGKGGALETVRSGVTGLFFREQNVKSLLATIAEFERNIDTFDPQVIREHSRAFGVDRFKHEMKEFISWCLDDHKTKMSANGSGVREPTGVLPGDSL